MYDNQYLGAIHIHTKFSDGSGDIQSISKDAKKAGLDWIIITDHNNFDVKEGIYNGVYVIKGEEISPKDSNHYLALGISNLIGADENAQLNIDNVRKSGGFGFAAHPDESSNRKNRWKPIKWKDKNIIPDGVEIWNWFSNWADNFDDRNIFTRAYSAIFKHEIITPPAKETLEWWDGLNKNSLNIVPAIGGIDAHAFKIHKYIIPLTIFPYKTYFDTITNVVTLTENLSNDFNIAKQQILNSIKNGNNLIINRKTCNSIPQFNITNKFKTVEAGNKIELTEDTYLNIKSANLANVKVIHNGELYSEQNGRNIKIKVNRTGKYRIELSHFGKKYAYSNPIQVIEG